MLDHDVRTLIAQLQSQIDDLRDQLDRLPRTAPTAAGTPVASRRQLLRLAGATAAGAVGVAITPSRAAAEIGYVAGADNDVVEAVNQRLLDPAPMTTSFVFTSGAGAPATNATDEPSALGGWAFAAAVPDGVAGTTSVDGGTGVRGAADGAGGIGVRAIATGERGVAVRAEATLLGVLGTATGATGTGLRGVAEGAAETGVAGEGGRYAVRGVTARPDGLGASFSGPAGALQLVATQALAPPARTATHDTGVLETDAAGNLWFCTASGAPGTWRKLAGPQSAGTFHPLPPGRVYDSRRPEPTPGVLTGGQNRTISVADRRNTDDGSIAEAGFVPPGALAIAANVTIVSVVAGGFLVCNPGGNAAITASTINWSAPGQVLANGVILALNANRELTVVAGGGSTHFLVDVTGYWL